MEAELPTQSGYFPVLGARIREIKAMENELANCEHGLRAFQKLPRNMQRRAVSTYSQRLPVYLREKHKREIGNKVKVNKRPSRKYRRRPSNLLSEYNRRQRNIIWLETHIWHAKRFHMEKKWGYWIPKSPTSKSYRPSLRAASKSCLVQDVSYECCFELRGPLSEIEKSLSSMTYSEDWAHLTRPEALRNLEWANVNLYMPDKYPFKAIGRAQLLWVSHSPETQHCKLWLWVHTSIYEELLSVLIDVFKLAKEEAVTESVLKIPDHVIDAKLSSKNVPVSRVPKYTSPFVTLLVLKDTLVKFRLTGPRSHFVLKNVLKRSAVKDAEEATTEECKKGAIFPWWIPFYSNQSHYEDHEMQWELWNSAQSEELPSMKVLGLTVRDPRTTLPAKKLPFEDEPKEDEKAQNVVPNIVKKSFVHPFCDASVRDSCTFSMKSTNDINELRRNLLVTGSALPLTKEESRVPVLLMQRPGSRVTKLGAGWDIVLPCGWGAPTLISLVMNGAAVGGTAQEECLNSEFLLPPNSCDMPDTTTSHLLSNIRRDERIENYFKKPPNCRENYIKLGVKFPFEVDWLELVKDWYPYSSNLYVLRERKFLKWLAIKSCKKIEKLVSQKLSSVCSKDFKLEDSSVDADGRDKTNCDNLRYNDENFLRDLEGHKTSLLYVRLILIGKGSLEPMAMICLPTAEDFNYYSPSEECLIEPQHEDTSKDARTKLKELHEQHLNSMRRKRKKARDEVLSSEENPLKRHKTMKEALQAAVDEVKERNKELVQSIESYEPMLRKLWLQNPDEKLQSCIRSIAGYLIQGGFCSQLGKSGGLGYVVCGPFIDYIRNMLKQSEEVGDRNDTPTKPKQIYVLVRNPTCQAYRWARIVILDVW